MDPHAKSIAEREFFRAPEYLPDYQIHRDFNSPEETHMHLAVGMRTEDLVRTTSTNRKSVRYQHRRFLQEPGLGLTKDTLPHIINPPEEVKVLMNCMYSRI